ncbi:MAG: DNA repair protein RecO [Paracidovorax wautersii]|uniref:DNA repair protein RecO n=1 Tax=Paracidovorax wautersii TaxID=1177982 RepID=A0A7V8FLS6_9BURK|nr:MAG: DNA repair protein RecO [Paracidovorax wautersii]
MAARRTTVQDDAFILHHYDWSESSLILDVFTREHGRVVLVAKGAKKPTSNFRPVLLPLQPIRVNYGVGGEQAEVHNLRGAEWLGGHVMPVGDALLSGYYLNELLMRLLARDDPHPVLFAAYAATVAQLADRDLADKQPALRAFELRLLREAGWLPALDTLTQTHAALDADAAYLLVPEVGLRPALDDERLALSGHQWRVLQTLLESDDPAAPATLQAVCAQAGAALRQQLRHLLNYHCGVSTLRIRQMMLDLQNL